MVCCCVALFCSENVVSLQWRHNRRDGVSNHQPHHCLLNPLFRRRSKKASDLRGTGLCEWNSPVTGEFPAQMASNAENLPMWWRLHAIDVWQISQDDFLIWIAVIPYFTNTFFSFSSYVTHNATITAKSVKTIVTYNKSAVVNCTVMTSYVHKSGWDTTRWNINATKCNEASLTTS